MSARGTTSTILIFERVTGEHLAKKKNLYFAFVNLEKAFDWEYRDVASLARLGVEEWFVKIVQ